MKKLFTLFFITISFSISFSQIGNSPYPIIFVHGLISDDHTWDNIIARLDTSFFVSDHYVLSAVLNARGGDTTNYLQDIVIPYLDISGNIANKITSSNIYAVNFNNFWNRKASDPRIIKYSNSTPGRMQSPGNQSAIYKQGCALAALIDSVLRVTGAEKVILLGHSMGGLAIREYLQRKENGMHKWWIDPNDSINGHKVAKVITIGTPHDGIDVSYIPFIGVDFQSEAMRDLRNSYTTMGNDAAFLHGNSESKVPPRYYNKDINCNGIITDTITGLDSGSFYNPVMPLPENISYTWIVSELYSSGSDGIVPVESQSLHDDSSFVPHGVTDTLMTDRSHIGETSDEWTLIRGLDEPDSKDFAYKIFFNRIYSGFITLQPNADTTDVDFFRFNVPAPGRIGVYLKSVYAGVTNMALLLDTSQLVSRNISAASDSMFLKSGSSDLYLKITGSSRLNPAQKSYRFNLTFLPALELNVTLGIEGMLNDSVQVRDTVRFYLRNRTAPYNSIDSAKAYLSSSGNAVVYFMNAPAGSYFIQAIHRNTIETWNAAPIEFVSGITTNLDLTVSQSQAFGNNQVLKSGKWCLYSGDVDRNQNVDLIDILLIYNDGVHFVSGYHPTDLNGDNIINLADLLIAYNNSSNFVHVIRP